MRILSNCLGIGMLQNECGQNPTFSEPIPDLSRLFRNVFRICLDFFTLSAKIFTMIKRLFLQQIQEDIKKKIVLITGPRQTGKTTLAKMVSRSYDYLTFDSLEHRSSILAKSWDRKKKIVIFDELHKMKNWKAWLKGVYDTEMLPPGLLVTGSAKLDTYKKAGDSLAGRFFEFRLHPLDLKEIQAYVKPKNPKETFEKLLTIGGFPEPFLEGTESFYGRWQKSHLDIILKQDLIELGQVHEIVSIETLIQLLKKQVGSLVSYASLARDLQHADKTIKRWLSILENLYVLFRVPPYHRNLARTLLKSPKYYFYDTGQVMGDNGQKFENLVACAFLKEIQYRADVWGEKRELYYLRNRDGKEVDFLVVTNQKPSLLVEAKWQDPQPSDSLRYWASHFPEIPKIQLVGLLERETTLPGKIEIRSAPKWLADFELP